MILRFIHVDVQTGFTRPSQFHPSPIIIIIPSHFSPIKLLNGKLDSTLIYSTISTANLPCFSPINFTITLEPLQALGTTELKRLRWDLLLEFHIDFMKSLNHRNGLNKFCVAKDIFGLLRFLESEL